MDRSATVNHDHFNSTSSILIQQMYRIGWSLKCCGTVHYDYNKKLGIFEFQSGYRKIYLNSPKGYSRKIISAQTDQNIQNRPVSYIQSIGAYFKSIINEAAKLLQQTNIIRT